MVGVEDAEWGYGVEQMGRGAEGGERCVAKCDEWYSVRPWMSKWRGRGGGMRMAHLAVWRRCKGFRRHTFRVHRETRGVVESVRLELT